VVRSLARRIAAPLRAIDVGTTTMASTNGLLQRVHPHGLDLDHRRVGKDHPEPGPAHHLRERSTRCTK